MENGGKMKFEPVYSSKIRAGRRRTYFFDVRETKGGDYFITLTESTRKYDGEGYERHKIFLYKEDFNRFLKALEDTVNYVKNELMPDYDFEEFERRQAEWERKKAEEAKADAGEQEEQNTGTDAENDDTKIDDEDMSW